MQFASALSRETQLETAFEETLTAITEQTAGHAIDLGFVFASGPAGVLFVVRADPFHR